MRKVVDRNQQVAHLWANQIQQEAYTSRQNFSFYGPELKSYYTTIGYHFGDFVLLSRDTMTPTTSQQLSITIRACSHKRVIFSGIFEYGRPYNRQPIPERILTDLEEHYKTLLQSLAKRKAAHTKNKTAMQIHSVVDDINFIIQYFRMDRAFLTVPSDVTELYLTTKALIETREMECIEASRRVAIPLAPLK